MPDWAEREAARCQERHPVSAINDSVCMSVYMPFDLGERIAAALRAARAEAFEEAAKYLDSEYSEEGNCDEVLTRAAAYFRRLALKEKSRE